MSPAINKGGCQNMLGPGLRSGSMLRALKIGYERQGYFQVEDSN